ncbi:TorD/DmsD family molecular chaperone [Trueperella bialowiezensis]|uniref:Uncharacterized component of anaerobic dehydrogenases n=1 Tax=Trueperella bialowiezensis TaxID=312285 RepID=A0A3S4YWS7_9ACTO|nr:molecular chaperone TorD family protein [Trueperella bialowiezensis]VEI12574.1 Uncharacterized component of anaerobic dehydrogenases [Trueperella bialowiezensis]
MATPWQDSVPEQRLRAVQRATALFSLARFYVEAPNSEVLRRFTDPQMAATWPVRDERSVAAMEQIASAGDPGRVVADDFAGLFGPAGTVKMAESEYAGDREATGAHSGGSARAGLIRSLREVYRAWRYQPLKMAGFPVDHFSVQLGFLGHLITQVGDDTGAFVQARDFYAGHLGYAERLLDHVERGARSVTYRAIAQMTRAALDVVGDELASVERSRGDE